LRLLRLRPLWLGLLGPLLRLCRGLRALLLGLALLWLPALRLRLLRLCLWALLLRGWRRSLLCSLVLLAALRVGGGHRPQKQKQPAGGNSNESHGYHLRYGYHLR
jgi:hypothetical protein